MGLLDGQWVSILPMAINILSISTPPPIVAAVSMPPAPLYSKTRLLNIP